MQRRLLAVLVLSSVAGLLVSFFVYRVIAGIAGEARAEKIVVAAVTMRLAETVTKQHVRLVPWPKQSIPAGALRSLEEADGRVVRSSIVAGEPLLEAKLAPQLSGRGGIMPMLVPAGRRGVTIKVSDAIRESGFVLPNSRVDVVVTMLKASGSRERISKVVLQDVLVLAAGQTVELRDNEPVTVTTVTLSLTPKETERLALAQAEGRLMLVTRNLRDEQVVRTPGATRLTLLDGHTPQPRQGPGAMAKRRTAVSAGSPARPTAKATPRAHTVWLFRGSKMTQHDFVRRADEAWVEKKK